MSQGRAIFTHDRDFLKLAATNEHTGIIYCRQQTRSVGDIIRGLVQIWEVYKPEELQNRVEYL